jgi:hypothetical protein
MIYFCVARLLSAVNTRIIVHLAKYNARRRCAVGHLAALGFGAGSSGLEAPYH